MTDESAWITLTLREVIDELDRIAAPASSGAISDHRKLGEALTDGVAAVASTVERLLTSARECPPGRWPARKSELLEELDDSFAELRESFALLHDSVIDPAESGSRGLADKLRSVDEAIYWHDRRR